MRLPTLTLALMPMMGILCLPADANPLSTKSCDAACIAAKKAAIDRQNREKKAASIAKRKAERAAATKKAMDAEIAADKAIAAQRAKEPGVVTQKCNLVNGQLVCK